MFTYVSKQVNLQFKTNNMKIEVTNMEVYRLNDNKTEIIKKNIILYTHILTQLHLLSIKHVLNHEWLTG